MNQAVTASCHDGGMPWRLRTATPLSHRGYNPHKDARPPMRFMARRIPAGESFVDRPLWQLVKLSPEARATLAALAPVCDPWEARLPDETEISAFVLPFRPWPEDTRVHLSDHPQLGEASIYTPVVVLTRNSATAVWGGAERVGFEALADDIYAHREAVLAPDLDALGTLAP